MVYNNDFIEMFAAKKILNYTEKKMNKFINIFWMQILNLCFKLTIKQQILDEKKVCESKVIQPKEIDNQVLVVDWPFGEF